MEKAKNILLSKTFWFNLITMIIAITSYIKPDILEIFGIPMQQETNILKIVGVVNSIGNIILRKFATKQLTVLPVPPASGRTLQDTEDKQ